MKTFLLGATVAALAWGALPVLAGSPDPLTRLTAADSVSPGLTADEFDRRGRGRHGGRPRVPGGSGCDDPRDLIEHPECRA